MDVLEIAKQRRAALERELARLTEFIEMGEELSSNGQLGSEAAAQAAAKQTNGGGAAANTIRQFSSGSAGGKNA